MLPMKMYKYLSGESNRADIYFGVKSKLLAEYVAASQNSPLNILQCVKFRRYILQRSVI